MAIYDRQFNHQAVCVRGGLKISPSHVFISNPFSEGATSRVVGKDSLTDLMCVPQMASRLSSCDVLSRCRYERSIFCKYSILKERKKTRKDNHSVTIREQNNIYLEINL